MLWIFQDFDGRFTEAFAEKNHEFPDDFFSPYRFELEKNHVKIIVRPGPQVVSLVPRFLIWIMCKLEHCQ